MKFFANPLGFFLLFVPLVVLLILHYFVENKLNIHMSNSSGVVALFFLGLLWVIADLLIRLNTAWAFDKIYFPNFARSEYGGVMVLPIYLVGLMVVFSTLTYQTAILIPGLVGIFVVGLIITVLAEV